MRSSGTPFMKLGLVSRPAMEIHNTLWFKVCKHKLVPVRTRLSATLAEAFRRLRLSIEGEAFSDADQRVQEKCVFRPERIER